jgi:hypothetical protein
MTERYLEKIRSELDKSEKSLYRKYIFLKEQLNHSEEEIEEILNVKLFNSLTFKPHPSAPRGISGYMSFDPFDEYWISVIGGPRGTNFRGDGVNDFEVWTNLLNNPSSWNDRDDVNYHMLEVQESYLEN